MAEAEASKSVAIRGRPGTRPSMAVGVVVIGRVRIPPGSKEYVRVAEGVGFEPTWRLAPPSRFRVDPVTATSVPLRAGKAVL